MFRSHNNKYNYVILFLAVVLIISILFTMCSSKKQDTLDVYTKSDVLSSTEAVTTEEQEIDTFTYSDDSNGFSVEIPSDWQKVTKDGYNTYIHGSSASSVQIKVEEYDPTINNCSSETLSAQVVENGYSFVTYNRLSSTSYELMYQQSERETYDYIEEVYWNRNCIVTLLCTFNDANYEKIYPYYTKIIQSFSWNEEPLLDGYFLYYSEIGDFEFGIPEDWTYSDAGGNIVAVNSDNTAQLSVTVQENNMTLENVSATDITGILSSGKSHFMLKEFETSYSKLNCKATYYSSDAAMTSDTYMYANGYYLYTIQLDYLTDSIDESISATVSDLFREFVSQKLIKSDNETGTENKE